MTPRNLFNIILKVLDILFIKDILAAVPALLGNQRAVVSYVEYKRRR